MPGYLPPDGIADFPISGFDWADGQNIGTPTPDDARLLATSPYSFGEHFFEELPDSPECDSGDVVTVRHRFRCDYETGQIYFQGLLRGSLMEDSDGNLSTVLNTSLNRQRGDTALLTVTAELILDPPMDEFQVTPIEFNLALEKHPRYHAVFTYNLKPDGVTPIDTTKPVGPNLVEMMKRGAQNPQTLYSATDANWLNATTVPGWNDPVPYIANSTTLGALITEMQLAYRRGEFEFYLSGWQVQWSWYYFGLSQLGGLVGQALYPADEGGYVQDPVVSGFLPSYFWSLDGTADHSDENNMLARLPVLDSNALYGTPANGKFSWLKQADHVEFNRTWFKQTLTWVGGPLGIWDFKVYPLWTDTGLKWQGTTT